MLFRYIGFRPNHLGSDKIICDCIFQQDRLGPYEFGKEFVLITGIKEIKIVITLLGVTKNLPFDIRKEIFFKTLITELRDEIFINQFDRYFLSDLELAIAYDDLPQYIKDFYNPGSSYTLKVRHIPIEDLEEDIENPEIEYLNYNSDNDPGIDY